MGAKDSEKGEEKIGWWNRAIKWLDQSMRKKPPAYDNSMEHSLSLSASPSRQSNKSENADDPNQSNTIFPPKLQSFPLGIETITIKIPSDSSLEDDFKKLPKDVRDCVENNPLLKKADSESTLQNPSVVEFEVHSNPPTKLTLISTRLSKFDLEQVADPIIEHYRGHYRDQGRGEVEPQSPKLPRSENEQQPSSEPTTNTTIRSLNPTSKSEGATLTNSANEIRSNSQEEGERSRLKLPPEKRLPRRSRSLTLSRQRPRSFP